MHAADRGVVAIDGEQLALPCKIAGEQHRYAILLHEHLGALQVA